MRFLDQPPLPRRWTLAVRFLAITLFAALARHPAAGQQPGSAGPPGGGPSSGSLFGETIEVRVVNVEAVVTDRQGNRVPDLKLEDFRLEVDGKPVKVDYFSEVRGGQAIVRGPGAASVPGLSDLAPGSGVGTSYLVFVDDYFSVGPRRDEVLRSLRDNLARLGPEDRMALVAFDGRHLHLLSSWSSSRRELAAAIEREIGTPTHGLERTVELRSFTSTDQHLGEVDHTAAKDRILGEQDTVVGKVATRAGLTLEEERFARN